MKKAILLLLLTALTLCAGVAGKWSGRIVVEGADNDMDVTLTLKEAGSTVSGTIGAPDQSGPIELQQVKVDGDKLTFDVPYRGQIFKFNVKTAAAEMKGTLKGATEDGSPVSGTVTFKKAS